jgi:hypothetical protein
MTAEDTAIVRGYEVLDMTPAQIAEDRGLDEFAVKAKLLQLSTQFRRDARNEPQEQDDLNFSDDQLVEANRLIYETMQSAVTAEGQVDHRLRSELARYIRDDKKGRKDVNKAVGGTNFNILQLNQTIVEARKLREARQPAKQLAETKQPIEV